MMHIIAHRGAASTHPENTMGAFIEAQRVGADGIEVDVQLSADGEVVIIHDEKLNRTTGAKGYVKDWKLSDLKKLNASFGHKAKSVFEKIPTLVELFDWLQTNQLSCIIELKNTVFEYPGLEEKVIQLIRMYGFENRVILASFNHYSLVYCYRLAPDIETAPNYREGIFMPWIYAKSIAAKGIHPQFRAAHDVIIKESLDAGMAIRPYTINTEEQMKHFFEKGCSGIITDDPKLAKQVRDRLISMTN
ncbi:glycerophosphodiester phosphodiesterase [Peribacillus asahii]|uniref:glycerophosphodiester phosphodiesterase n=1 Tax=Peribacillus asahii TaxID=228899 RepID=UPI0020794909|nr:glycerophosphodiester phosphodiesterase [Peribacillus asahii]USK69108.1 glycerophosphodiester phosphodiesterase [Peribacillus asahii]